MERAEVYKIWIQPIVNRTARVYEPDQSVLSSMKVIFRMALRVTPWGLAPSMVVSIAWEGGCRHNPCQCMPSSCLHSCGRFLSHVKGGIEDHRRTIVWHGHEILGFPYLQSPCGPGFAYSAATSV